MIELASSKDCTGCGVCSFVCPTKSISLIENRVGVLLPKIDVNTCISCGKCIKSCPILNPSDRFKPFKVYASWHSKQEDRFTSASGGVAAAAYFFALKRGFSIAGAVQNSDFSVSVICSKDVASISLFKNSKYVYSDITQLLEQLKQYSFENEPVLVIALPCQISAIRKAFPKYDNLVLVDLVCHGSTPTSYLQQHIRFVEDFLGKKAVRMSFRDPELKTSTFHFTLYDSCGERFYSKQTVDRDTYQFGYHKAISYRENCFHCRFACSSRLGDFSLCDYYGLGRIEHFNNSNENVSCILVNTPKGHDFVNNLINNNYIEVVERPVSEPIKGNKQLQCPCEKSKERLLFEKLIFKNNGDFEKTMNYVLCFERIHYLFHYVYCFPFRVLRKINNMYKNIFK